MHTAARSQQQLFACFCIVKASRVICQRCLPALIYVGLYGQCGFVWQAVVCLHIRCETDVSSASQVEPPKDPETYIHRSGRTGRAGHTGVCITLVGRKHEELIPYIEKKAGFTFERVGAPQPAEMAKIAAERWVYLLQQQGSKGCVWDACQQRVWA